MTTLRTQEIVDTIKTLEIPTQRDAEYNAIKYREMIERILPMLEADATASEIALALCCECPKFGG